MTAAKTFPITKMLVMGPFLAAISTANALISGDWWNWITVGCGIVLTILALIAKLIGRTNA